MVALLYIVVMCVLGDTVGRRFFNFVSTPHRFAVAFLVGLLLSSWWTYLAALLFAGTASPMFWGNIVFFGTAVGLIVWLRSKAGINDPSPDRLEYETWDLVFIVIFLLLASWLMFSTFNVGGGMLRIGFHEFFDFGQTVSIQQSFAEGVNFPTDNPHYAGERIRSYFLFYFQAGNLGYLGLNAAWSNNLLSILSMASMLTLVMTLGRVLFDSAWAGRLGAMLFFFHGSLSFIPFLKAQTSFAGLIEKLSTTTTFLNSGLQLKGEDWGVWTQNVFVTQRNLTSSIGLLLIVLIFLITQFRESESDDQKPETAAKNQVNSLLLHLARGPYVFCGIILGLLPMWNGAVLVPGLFVIGLLLIIFKSRREMFVMLAVTAILAVLQLIYLKSGAQPATFSYLHWAYLFENPSVLMVLYFPLFTFGFKWLLIGWGLARTGRMQKLFFAAVSVLLVLTFTTRFTEELLANHKYINIWLIIANVYVGYGLVRLRQLELWKSQIPTRILAVVLVVLITITGVFDLAPIRNSAFIDLKYDGDPLVEWVRKNTDPRAVFLTHRYSNHQILLAGRQIFFGEQYYGWESRHNTSAREAVYKQMLESSDPNLVFKLLKENNIRYVAIDDSIRSGRNFIKQPNESLFQTRAKLVFNDKNNQYANLKIYDTNEVTTQ